VRESTTHARPVLESDLRISRSRVVDPSCGTSSASTQRQATEQGHTNEADFTSEVPDNVSSLRVAERLEGIEGSRDEVLPLRNLHLRRREDSRLLVDLSRLSQHHQ
jgi:hypothetical protein